MQTFTEIFTTVALDNRPLASFSAPSSKGWKDASSPFTTQEAQAVCRLIGGTFASSIGNAAHLSPRQLPWVHILAAEKFAAWKQELEGDADRAEVGNGATGFVAGASNAILPNVIALFDTAAAELKFPHLTLMTADGHIVRLHRAGERSRHKGTITITDGTREQEGYYGRVWLDGRFEAHRFCPASVVTLVMQLNDDIDATVGAYAALTGRCSYCSLPLTDPESVRRGYGETCAGNYGRPWGTPKAPKTTRPASKRGKVAAAAIAAADRKVWTIGHLSPA